MKENKTITIIVEAFFVLIAILLAIWCEVEIQVERTKQLELQWRIDSLKTVQK